MLSEQDEQYDFHATTAKRPRTVSRVAFSCLLFAMAMAITIAETGVITLISKTFALGIEPALMSGLAFPNLILAALVADRILKRMGLSRSGRIVEGRKRTTATPEGTVDDVEVVEVVEVSCPRSLLTTSGVGLLGLFVVSVSLLLVSSDLPTERFWVICGGVVLSGFLAVGCFHEWWRGAFQARADSSGILAYPMGRPLSQKFVPWSAVATCEIVTHFNTFGERTLIEPILKGSDGQTLLAVNLISIKIEDQERLVTYIRAKLPKPDEDPWAWE